MLFENQSFSVILYSDKTTTTENEMRTLTAQQAAQFCIDHNISQDRWSCGYILETILETDHNIVLTDDEAWQELEDILFYSEPKK